MTATLNDFFIVGGVLFMCIHMVFFSPRWECVCMCIIGLLDSKLCGLKNLSLSILSCIQPVGNLVSFVLGVIDYYAVQFLMFTFSSSADVKLITFRTD